MAHLISYHYYTVTWDDKGNMTKGSEILEEIELSQLPPVQWWRENIMKNGKITAEVTLPGSVIPRYMKVVTGIVSCYSSDDDAVNMGANKFLEKNPPNPLAS